MSNLTAPLGSRPVQSLFTPSSAQDSAAAQLASEGGNPLDWYLSLSRGKGDSSP